MTDMLDLLVVGGGINGAGIARDAAGRGLSVLLCEKGDLGGGTSSKSSKLIHGGLRYLEHYEFRLVREALKEREVLLRLAPHIVWPLRFVLPHGAGQRPAWLVRTGLFLYDHLGGRQRLAGTRKLDLSHAPEGRMLKPEYRTGFEYSDCWTEDARLVVANALDAQAHGATVLTRTECVTARRNDGAWHAVLRGPDGEREVRARILVNAAGPWVERVVHGVAGLNNSSRVRQIKGSHLVTRKFWDGDQAYILQNDDNRVVFVIPYQGDLGLIGTTDVPYEGRAEDVSVSEQERDYLLRAVNRYARTALTRADVVAEYAGIRPLYDDAASNPSAITRDYVFDVDAPGGQAPILSIFGGKITTYRRLAEHALEKLAPHLPAAGPAWTGSKPLPGGDMPNADFDAWLAGFRARHPWLSAELSYHYARQYGTRAEALLDGAKSVADLGAHFGGLLHAREAEFLRRTEWATEADDVLERRTKQALHMTMAQQDTFRAWWNSHGSANPTH